MDSKMTADAILLVGHGTRNEMGQQQFLALAQHLRAAVAPLPVEVAYIELQAPLIADALIALHARGLKNIRLSPALLFAAGHAKQDIPAAVQVARQQCPELIVTLAEPLGCHDALIELAAFRFHHCLSPVLRGEGRGEGPDPPSDPPASTALVLVGRGSSDPAAIAHCEHFAARLAEVVKANRVFTGFIAIAQPSLKEALDRAAASGCRRIVVQPHLLFRGEMLETTTAAVNTARQLHPAIDWRQADVLGSDLGNDNSLAASQLVSAFQARISEASARDRSP